MLPSCLKEDSIYHIDDKNLPIVSLDNNIQIENNFIKIKGSVVDAGSSNLLRFGHLWGVSPALSFNENNFIDYSEFYENYNSFETIIQSYDNSMPMYYRAFAINEAGISYSQTKQICPELYYDRYEIISESIEDNKINPGETVIIRFYIKNNSPINSVSSNIHSITQSIFFTYINPISNIPLTPNTVSYFSNGSFFDVEITMAQGANAFIEFQIYVMDWCENQLIDLKDINGNNPRLNIN